MSDLSFLTIDNQLVATGNQDWLINTMSDRNFSIKANNKVIICNTGWAGENPYT